MKTIPEKKLLEHDLLIAYGGFARKLEKGAIIFREGDMPYFFYQVMEGTVKLFSTNAEGKELIQGVFKCGQSFGEPPLLLNKPYPSTAQATAPCVIIKIARERLLNILKDFPETNQKLMYAFARRIYDKSTAVQVWINQSPEDKIKSFFAKIKSGEGTCDSPFLVPYTRQQIADFTGLRVETVIRTLIKMDKEKKVNIIDHKVYY